MRSLQRASSALLKTAPSLRSYQCIYNQKITAARSIRPLSTLPKLSIFEAIANHEPQSTAVIHSASRRSFTYAQLLHDVSSTKARLVEEAQGQDLSGERIAFMAENGYDYVVMLLAIFSTNSIAMPLGLGFPVEEHRYMLEHSGAKLVLSTPKFEDKARNALKERLSANPKFVRLEKIESVGGLGGDSQTLERPALEGTPEGKGGMMLYTSGTTNRPKGVLLPFDTLTAQSQSLLKAWSYSPEDHLLHTLPLHHIHGTVNALLTPLFAGSTIEFLYPFNPTSLWTRLAAPFLPATTPQEQQLRPKSISFFTAVPTIYTRLLSTFPTLTPALQLAAKQAISPKNLRLNISGSAALPTPTKSAWTDLSSGNVLLERYGMTEVGMALSCALDPSSRIDGSVGYPLPSVEVRLVDPDTGSVITGEGNDGEIQLRGPTIFKEYWNNPEATMKEFVPADEEDSNKGKWFKTGDIALRRTHSTPSDDFAPINCKTNLLQEYDWSPSGPHYHILGRRSADIIKTGGEKVSALEVERELLSLPNVAEAAVVAVASGRWGEKVGAVVVLKDEPAGGSTNVEDKKKAWSPMDMRRALKDKLANYKIPQVLKVVDTIERNAMGKSKSDTLFELVGVDGLLTYATVNKKQLVKKMFPPEDERE